MGAVRDRRQRCYPEAMSTDPESLLGRDPLVVPRSVLSEEVHYSGQHLTVRSLESLIDQERTRQNQQVQELQALRARNTELQQTVVGELARLRQLTQQVL